MTLFSNPNLPHCAALALVLTAPLMAHAAKYEEPTGDSTASIEFVNDTAQSMTLMIFADAKECTGRGLTVVKSKEPRKLAVAAGKDLAFTALMDAKVPSAIFALGPIGLLVGAEAFKGCRPVVQFHPEPGHTYVFQSSADGKDCSYKLYEKPAVDAAKADQDSPAEKEIHVAIVEREYSRGWSDAGSWCKDKAPDAPKSAEEMK